MKKLLVMSAAAAVLFAASAPAAFATTLDSATGKVTVEAIQGSVEFASVPDVAITGGEFGFKDGNLVANDYSAAFVGADGKAANFTVTNTDQSAKTAYVQAAVSGLPEGVTLKVGDTELGATTPVTVATNGTSDLTTGEAVALTSSDLTASVSATAAAAGTTEATAGTISYTLTDTLPTGQE